DSNQDNQIQNLMYCQLYDLPAEGRQQKRAVGTTLNYFTDGTEFRQQPRRFEDISRDATSREANPRVGLQRCLLASIPDARRACDSAEKLTFSMPPFKILPYSMHGIHHDT
ncbi:MAG: hypothetical protein WA193_07560, partial [Candidatus Acidiferrales bacterium]